MRTPDARSLGMLTLGLLLVLAIPGIVLALNYEPDARSAHDTVVSLDGGALRSARGAHAWAASLVLALSLLHVARGYVVGRFGAPGRGAMLAGVALLGVVVVAYFSGTILPWDQQGWEAFEHMRQIAFLPEVAPDAAPLGPIFYAHVFGPPIALVGLVWFHIRRAEAKADVRRIAKLARATILPILVGFAVVIALALVWPPPLGPAPLEGVEVTRPDWPFLWLVPLQDAFGSVALWILPLLFGGGAWIVARRKAPASPRKRRIVVIGLAIAFIFLTLLGAR